MEQRTVELKTVNGRIVLAVRPATLGQVNGRKMSLHSLVESYNRLIAREAIAISEDNNVPLCDTIAADNLLFPCLYPYYQTVLDILAIGDTKIQEIAPQSRHEFFITCGLKEIEGKQYLRQSGLSWLLGYEEKDTPSKDSSGYVDKHSTGSLVLDSLGRASCFYQKGPFIELAEFFSPPEMMAIMGYAGAVMKEAMDEGKASREEEPEINYAIAKDEIDKLREQGFDLPGFAE